MRDIGEIWPVWSDICKLNPRFKDLHECICWLAEMPDCLQELGRWQVWPTNIQPCPDGVPVSINELCGRILVSPLPSTAIPHFLSERRLAHLLLEEAFYTEIIWVVISINKCFLTRIAQFSKAIPSGTWPGPLIVWFLEMEKLPSPINNSSLIWFFKLQAQCFIQQLEMRLEIQTSFRRVTNWFKFAWAYLILSWENI